MIDEAGVRTVGVLGVGTMGAGIVQLAAQTGHEVVACDLSVEALERAQLYVRDGLLRFARKGAFSEEEAKEHYARIHWTMNLEDMADADAAIEVIVEKVAPKKEAFARLDEILPPDSLI
ncbi:MAG: 3-hydroxyacyl-CoA dehydrogenase NAD-binding domain-containing protein, partial [Rubrobacteraceae bacterium]